MKKNTKKIRFFIKIRFLYCKISWNHTKYRYNANDIYKDSAKPLFISIEAFSVMKKTRIKKIWKKRRNRVANGGSESSLFLEIYEKRGGKSDLTWTYYNKEDLQSFQFAHILPKGMYPEYRLNPDNIIFVDSIEQHERVDRTVARNKAVFKDFIDRWIARKHLRQIWNHPILFPLRSEGKLPLGSDF